MTPPKDVLIDKTLTSFYFEELSTLALTDGTIITSNLHAIRIKDIRNHIRTTPTLYNGKYFGENLPINKVSTLTMEQYFKQPQLHQTNHIETEVNLTDVASRLKRLQQKAVSLGSSDIHIELYEHSTQFYARVDGRRIKLEPSIPLHEVGEKLFGYIFTSKAKLKDADFAAINPNNGTIEEYLDCPLNESTQESERRLTFWRASYIPAKGGGKVTLRWLNASKKIPALDEMGLHSGHISMLKSFCFGNSGLCMIAGKTGSGKSTLIAALLMLFGKDKAVHTVEDPPEFDLGIPQTQATPNQLINDEKTERGFNFYSKILLRHDVDVELHGEVRDKKGAMEVTRKGETGQIMFTTLHTSSAIGIGHTLTEQLHVPTAVVAAPDLMRIWAYQTLVRTLCPHCKMSLDQAKTYYNDRGDNEKISELEAQAQRVLKDDIRGVKFKHPAGCDRCCEGERGRTGLFEIIVLDDEDRGFILNKDYISWQKALKTKGFKNVRDHAVSKIKAGLIDIETASQKVSHLIPARTQDIYKLLNYNPLNNQDESSTPKQQESLYAVNSQTQQKSPTALVE